MDTAKTENATPPNSPGLLSRLRRKRLAAAFGRRILQLLKNPYLYLGIFLLGTGIRLTIASQQYLQDYVSNGKTLPVLSDIVLDNLPYWDIGWVYDLFSVVALFVFAGYVIHRDRFARIPYYLILCGVFHIVRGVFIVLTPFGHPPLFDGTAGPFHGFSYIEIGVYPSGHTGINFLYYLLATDKRYREILLCCAGVVILALFLARGHYSIDILSGIFFAYAIKSFGDKYILERSLYKHE